MEQIEYVKLTKMEERGDALHPFNKPVGMVRYGCFTGEPQVGEPFTILGISFRDGYRGLRTSLVQEILSENQFKTYNSVYQWEKVLMEEIPGFNKFGERLAVNL